MQARFSKSESTRHIFFSECNMSWHSVPASEMQLYYAQHFKYAYINDILIYLIHRSKYTSSNCEIN